MGGRGSRRERHHFDGSRHRRSGSADPGLHAPCAAPGTLTDGALAPERRTRATEESARLAGKTVDELIACFNDEVGKEGWVAARGRYLIALRLALLATGLDCSSFIDGESMSLASKVGRIDDAIVVLNAGAQGARLILVKHDPPS